MALLPYLASAGEYLSRRVRGNGVVFVGDDVPDGGRSSVTVHGSHAPVVTYASGSWDSTNQPRMEGPIHYEFVKMTGSAGTVGQLVQVDLSDTSVPKGYAVKLATTTAADQKHLIGCLLHNCAQNEMAVIASINMGSVVELVRCVSGVAAGDRLSQPQATAGLASVYTTAGGHRWIGTALNAAFELVASSGAYFCTARLFSGGNL